MSKSGGSPPGSGGGGSGVRRGCLVAWIAGWRAYDTAAARTSSCWASVAWGGQQWRRPSR